MKFLNPFALFSFFVCITTSLYCQDLKEGYYINTNGDTIKGYITAPGNAPGFSFHFKNKFDTNTSSIPFMLCKGLRYGEQEFITWYGKRSMSYVDKIDQSVVNIDSGITGLIPLRLVFKGNRTSLYHFKDKTDHFFISMADSVQELIILYRPSTEWERKPFPVNPPTYIVNPAFRNQLMMLMGDGITDKQVSWIGGTEYEETSLKKFLKKFD